MNATRLLGKNLMPVLITSMLMSADFQSLAGSLVPVNLQCEYRPNPMGIDVTQPRLIWQVQSDEHDQRQTAYEVQAASSKELLST
jgi:alpha-L-rhamnosidase